jgi:hypothetical protein
MKSGIEAKTNEGVKGAAPYFIFYGTGTFTPSTANSKTASTCARETAETADVGGAPPPSNRFVFTHRFFYREPKRAWVSTKPKPIIALQS